MGEKRAYKPRKPGGGRKKLKPEYDAGKNLKVQMDAAVALYNSEMSLQAIADALNLNPIKVRKLLITAGVYESDAAKKVKNTFEEYRKTQDHKTAILSTAAVLKLSNASVTSYLPYEKGVYFLSAADKKKISVGAERQRRYRAVRKLRTEPTEEHLWEVVLLYADVRFKTYSGLPFTYEIRKGRNTAFVSKMAFDAENSLIMLPVETGMGASPTTGYVDLWAYPKSSQKSDLVLTYGLTWDLRNYAGLFAYRVASASTKAPKNGSRLIYIPLNN